MPLDNLLRNRRKYSVKMMLANQFPRKGNAHWWQGSIEEEISSIQEQGTALGTVRASSKEPSMQTELPSHQGRTSVAVPYPVLVGWGSGSSTGCLPCRVQECVVQYLDDIQQHSTEPDKPMNTSQLCLLMAAVFITPHMQRSAAIVISSILLALPGPIVLIEAWVSKWNHSNY